MFDNKLFVVQPKASSEKAVDSLEELIYKLRVTLGSEKMTLNESACVDGTVAAAEQSRGMRFRTKPRACLFPT